MPNSTRRFSIFLLLAGLIIGCSPALVTRHNLDQHADRLLITADSSYQLTTGDLYRHLTGSKWFPHGGDIQPSAYQPFLDSVLADTLAGLKAIGYDLKQHYRYYRLYRQRHHDRLLERFWKVVVFDSISVDSAEAAEFFHARGDLFGLPEQIRIRHILSSPKTMLWSKDSVYYTGLTAEEIKAEAFKHSSTMKAKLDSGYSFEQVAFNHSHDALTRSDSGQVDWIAKGVLRHPFDSIAFSLGVGGVSDPYWDGDGWHIIRVDDYVAEGIPELTPDLYGSALVSLAQEKGNERGVAIADSIAGNLVIVHNDDVINGDVYALDPTLWAATVNELDTVTVDDLRVFEEAKRRRNRLKNSTPEMKKEGVAQFARRFALIRAAINMGLEQDSLIASRASSSWQKDSKMVLKQSRLDPGWEPSKEQIKAYWDEHYWDFNSPKPLSVQHIIVKDSTFGEFVRAQARSGIDFLDLAQDHYPGDPELRRELADIGPISEEDMPQAFYNVAMSTRVGDVSYPVKTEYGYHIIKVTESRPPTDFGSARFKIIQTLQAKHAIKFRKAFQERLFTEFHLRKRSSLPVVHLQPLDYRTEQQ